MTKSSKQKPNGVHIQGDGNVVGNRNNVNVTKIGSDPTELAQAFAKIYEAIGKIPDPIARKTAETAVNEIKVEAQKGQKADSSQIESWLKFLANMAPDIKDVVINTLSNPVLGVSTVIEKVIAKAKE